MNGGSQYTGWFYKSHISYADYIQGRGFERSIRYGINEQSKQIIASNEQLARENYKVLEQIGDGISSGFTTLSTDIESLQDSVDSGFQRLASTFEWGSSEMLVSLGRVNDSLDVLTRMAKTPAQTWAYEQFEIARDEFRRGLYSESLESVLRAINGFGSNPGYKTEFRFHFLQGTIRLGSYKNDDRQVIDTADSEAAFLKAARYSSNNLPAEAARSLLCAGRAAFTQGQLDVALKHSCDAIALDGTLAEAYFQSAQICCALGRPKEANAHLVTAIVYDHNYSVKASSDGDISQYPDTLKDALLSAKNKLKIAYDNEKENFQAALKKTRDSSFDSYSVSSLCSAQLKDADAYSSNLVAEASKDNIFGYVYAAKLARDGKNIIQSVVTSFQASAGKLIDEEQKALRGTIASVESEVSNSKPKDSELIDMVFGGAALIGLLSLFVPADIIGGLIVGFAILIAATGKLTLLVLLPFAKMSYFIRKSMWALEESKAKSKNRTLQEKISDLHAIRSRISSFTIENKNT